MAEKIFVDLDEEIIFIAEKIKRADKKKAILVVPERAALLGSVVSLKLLASEILKTDKLIVLVAEDEVGASLAKRAQLVVVPKVNQITSDTWEKAKELKIRLRKVQESERKKLLEERKESESGKEATKGEKGLEKLNRMQPKKVSIDGFEMVAGGDIAEFGEKETEEVSRKESEDKGKKEGKGQEEEQEKGLVGRDLSSLNYTSIAKKRAGEKEKDKVGIGGYVNKAIAAAVTFFKEGGSRTKVIIAISIGLIVFFALSYFVFPRGKVVIKVESQDIELTKNVIADTSLTALDVESLTIPAEELSVTKDRSGEASATGERRTGETAQGQVTIFNLTESAVTIQAGTVLEAIESGLEYRTTADVSVPAKKPDDDPESPGLIGNEDAGIVAVSFGEEYNISKKTEFRVEGYDLENLYGKNFNNVTGGTSEEVKVVSQKDYDDLKAQLQEELQRDLLEDLKGEAGSEREILEDTIGYEVINEDPTPGVESEAEILNLSITVKATALSFSKKDVDSLAEILVEEEGELHVEVEEFEYSSNVTNTEGEKIYIELYITGVVTPSVNEDEIKVNLSRKNLSQARSYLEEQDEIKDFSIDLYPSYLPSFLKHFPSSPARIEVEIEKV